MLRGWRSPCVFRCYSWVVDALGCFSEPLGGHVVCGCFSDCGILEALSLEELLDEAVGGFMVWESLLHERGHPGDEVEAAV